MRPVLWGILAFSLLVSLWAAWGRYRLESSNRSVEIVLDYDGFSDFCLREGLSPSETLLRFQKLGVSALAPTETTLEKLHQAGKLLWIRGEDLPLYARGPRFAGILAKNLLPPPSVLVLVRDKGLETWLGKALSSLLGSRNVRTFPGGFAISGKWDELSVAGLGFFPGSFKGIALTGLALDPRVENRDSLDSKKLDYLLANTASLPRASTLIFTGLRNEVLGFEHHLPDVARFLREHDLKFGYLEAYEKARAQKGSEELARLALDRTVKVQALTMLPLTRLDPDKAVETFLLGVRERNVRIIYYRPFLINYGGKSLLETNESYLNELKAALEQSGFVLRPAEPFPPFRPGLVQTLAAVAGIVAATAILFGLLTEVPVAWVGTGFLLVLSLAAAAFLAGRDTLLRSALAFWAGNLFVMMGLVFSFPRKPLGFGGSVKNFLKASLFTMAGGIFVSALLAGSLTLLGIQTFRGVKLLLMVPPLLAVWLTWLRHETGGPQAIRDLAKKSLEPFRSRVTLAHLVLALALLGVGALMILRSGNAPPEGAVPPWEKAFRTYLEQTLVARPRFKEIFLGHPFFLLGAALGLESGLGPILLFLAGVGQADILDSFAHLHTPLRFTLLRTFHGLWIGLLLGLILRLALRGGPGRIPRRGEEPRVPSEESS